MASVGLNRIAKRMAMAGSLALISGACWAQQVSPDYPGITEYPLPAAGSFPVGITAGPDGAVWVAEELSHKIARITQAGAITEYGVSSAPSDITSGPDGALWFTEDVYWLNAIGRITTSGAVTEFARASDSYPRNIVSGPDGALWFTEVNFISRITTAGSVTQYARPGGGQPSSLASGPDGGLWFDGSGIVRMSTSGAFTFFDPSVPNNGPVFISSGPDGALWFGLAPVNSSQYAVHLIGRMTTNGKFTYYAIPGFTEEIIAGRDGAVWFSEGGRSRGLPAPAA